MSLYILQVGGTLLDVLLKSVTFESDASNPDSKPMRVFYHVYEFIAERKVGYVKVRMSALLCYGGISLSMYLPLI